MSNIDVITDASSRQVVDESPDETQVADEVESADLRLAGVHAAPDIEFLTIPLARGASTRILNFDASRSRIEIWANDTGVVLSTRNVSGLIPLALKQAFSGAAVFPFVAPVFLIPALNWNSHPVEFRTQSELWAYNVLSDTDNVIYLAVERYSSGV